MQHAKPVDEITVHGLDPDVTECDHCGRVNLKYTVAISMDGGPIVHYGRDCATTALRVGRGSVSAAIRKYKTDQLKIEIEQHIAKQIGDAKQEREEFGQERAEWYRQALVESGDVEALQMAQSRHCKGLGCKHDIIGGHHPDCKSLLYQIAMRKAKKVRELAI